MRKRNLFSKIVAGIGALAMVATMLPAMAVPALAVDQVVALKKPDADTNNGSYTIYQISKTQYNNGVTMTDGDKDTVLAGMAGSLVGFGAPDADGYQTSTTTNWGANDAYFLVVPDMYYEFTAAKTLSVTDKTAGSGTWIAKPNTADTSSVGQSWLLWIDTTKLDLATLSNIDFVKLNIKVDGGDGITISQSNGPEAERNNPFTSRTYTMYWDKQKADSPLIDNAIVISSVPTRLANEVYKSTATDKLIKAGAELDVSMVDERRITLQGTKTGNMDMKINGTYIQKHALVSQQIAVNASVNDTTPYIELGNADTAAGTDLRPFSREPLGTLPKTYTYNTTKADYDDIITTNEITFSIWWENLWALFWHGYADGKNGGDSHDAATPTPGDESAYAANTNGVPNARTFASTRFNYFTGADRTLTISLGTTLAEGDVIFINDENGKTATDSVASRYAYQFQFRDENGKRWDVTEDSGVLSSDPARVTVEDFTEGEELAFTIVFDDLYQEGTNWRVTMTDANGNSQDITDKKGDDGVYRVKLGSGFDYTIRAENAAMKKTRKVVNLPQDDAIYSANHNEAQFQSFRMWDFYAESIFVSDAWMGRGLNNCNVVAPRYELYLQATEEDNEYIDVFPFAVHRAIGTTDDDYLGHDFPIGTYKFKIRYADQFVELGHGLFNADTTDDRYGEGDDFKVTIDGQTATKGDDGLYTLNVTEGDDPIIIKVDGLTRMYRVYAPNLAGYDIEANYEINRESYDQAGGRGVGTQSAINFRSAVPEGKTYSFKIKPSDGTQKGPDFKVYLRAASDDLDRDNSVTMTEIKEGEDGSYSFTVYNDTEIVVSGMTGTGFNDVNNRSAEEQEAINYLKDAGVLEGYDDGSFRPGNNLTRGEFVTMLQRLQKGTAGTASFSDTSGHWAAGAIGWASGQSVVNGYPDGSFRPNASISRAEVSQIMWKLNGSQRANMVAPFSDVNQGAWYAPAVNWNFEKGIIKGYGDGRFGTNEPIERAHMALILYRAR